MKYLKYIKSKAVKDYIVNNNIELDSYQIAKIIWFSTNLESVKMDRYKEVLDEITDEDVLYTIKEYINRYETFMNTFDQEGYIYILSDVSEKYNYENIASVFTSASKAYEFALNELLDEDTDCFSITKYIIDPDKFGDVISDNIYYKCINNEIFVYHSTALSITMDDELFKVTDKIEECRFPNPFKNGDRIRPIKLDEYGYEGFRDYLQKYDPDEDFIFIGPKGTHDDIRYDDNFGITWLESKDGNIIQHCHDFVPLMTDYEDDECIKQPYNSMDMESNINNSKYIAAHEIQNAIRGERFIACNAQDAIECLKAFNTLNNTLFW